MINKIILHAFFLGLASSDWVEIKIVNKNTNKKTETEKTITATPSNYEAILVRPEHAYEISTTTPAHEITEHEKNILSTPYMKSVIETFADDIRNQTVSQEDGSRKLPNEIKKAVKVFNNVTKNKDDVELKDRSNDSNEDYVGYLDDGYKDKGTNYSENDSSFESVLKHVQSNLLNYKGTSLKGKIKILKSLRDNMLYEIKSRMSSLWQPQKEKEEFEPRGYKDYYPDDHYHMDFPSNEGALMTIGFLTFAVFLIKLVLKLIYTLKYKQQYYYPTTTTTAASIFLKRSEREIGQDQLAHSAKIMQYIEEYPLSSYLEQRIK